jgi:uncharacterized protein YciI
MPNVLLEYSLADDYLERRGKFRAEHLALLEAATERGELLLAGPLTDPFDRALFVWREDAREAAETFAAADPYVVNGIVLGWSVRGWNTVVGTALT